MKGPSDSSDPNRCKQSADRVWNQANQQSYQSGHIDRDIKVGRKLLCNDLQRGCLRLGRVPENFWARNGN